jgi:hypothetical protein
MTSATALVAQQNLPCSFDELARHLRVTSYQVPRVVIDQEPGLGAQYALAAMHLTFASVLIWHATRALPGAVNAAAHRRLARIPRTTLLATSTLGIVGWAWAIAETIIFIWR